MLVLNIQLSIIPGQGKSTLVSCAKFIKKEYPQQTFYSAQKGHHKEHRKLPA